MKKVIVVVVLIVFAVTIMSAGEKRIPAFRKKQSEKKTCVGFTVLEAGKGVNCKGDTVRLVKINGFYTVSE